MDHRSVFFTIDSLRVGGAETMLVNIVNRLALASDDKMVITLSQDNPLTERIDRNKVRVVSIPRSSRYDLKPAYYLRKLIDEHNAESILCFDLFDYFFVRTALRIRARKDPRIIIIMNRTYPDNLKDYLQTFYYARLLKHGEILVATSNRQADVLSKFYFIPRGRFKMIYNGIDTDYFDPRKISGSKAATREKFNIPEGVFLILMVANFTKAKAHEDALFALKHLCDSISPEKFLLVLAGHTTVSRQCRLRRLASRLGLEKKVLFIIAHPDLRPVYLMSDCFTLSSRSEAFPVAAIEAMAMGLPCVLTDVGGTREMIRDGIDGYIVPPKDPALLAQGWRKIMLARHGFDAAEIRRHAIDNFSIDECVARYSFLLRC